MFPKRSIGFLFSKEWIIMKNFIEELFYGNIDPQARGYTNDSNIKLIAIPCLIPFIQKGKYIKLYIRNDNGRYL